MRKRSRAGGPNRGCAIEAAALACTFDEEQSPKGIPSVPPALANRPQWTSLTSSISMSPMIRTPRLASPRTTPLSGIRNCHQSEYFTGING
jgi:hypothetical protein